jgi:hypothetical protein
MNMKHEIDTQVLQKVMNYLGSKPYAEVAELVKEVLASAKKVEEKE